ncbi:Uncharacterised protein [Mycobacteroides abscessus]|nr:Uncharacterised protein [Mycobacteroides abscessus]
MWFGRVHIADETGDDVLCRGRVILYINEF